MGTSSSQLAPPTQATQPGVPHVKATASRSRASPSIVDTAQERPKKRKQSSGEHERVVKLSKQTTSTLPVNEAGHNTARDHAHSTSEADVEISAHGQPGPKKRKRKSKTNPLPAADPPEPAPTWLTSQDTPLLLKEPVEGEAESTRPETPRKRVRVFTAEAGADDEHQYPLSAVGNAQSAEEETKGTSKGTQPHKSTGPPLTTATGAFTLEEKEVADRIFDQTLRSEHVSESQLIAQIQNWRTCATFKPELEAALPSRAKPSIRKFAQRRFHAHQCGPWTAEQDQALRDAQARYPDKWSQISDLVDRTAGDCKDRWRSHLQYGDKKIQGPWTQEEEDLLQGAVEECIQKIRTSNPTSNQDIGHIDTLISWSTVAEKLQGRRSMKQCREKYEKLKHRNTRSAASRLNPAVSTNEAAAQGINEHEEWLKRCRSKQRTAQAILANFEIGDYYDVFVEIHSSFPDHSVRFYDEDNVLWSAVGTQNRSSRFSACPVAATLRRAALETALEEWPNKFKKVRRKLNRVETVPAKALVLAKYIEKKYPDRLDSLPRTYKPELIGKSAQEILQINRATKSQQKRAKARQREVKSKDLVYDSNEGEGEAE